MRLWLFALAVLLGAAAIGTRAEAQNYPWCARYSGSMADTQNCGFVSYDQCMETIRGMGGYCEVNNQYQPAAGATAHPPGRVRRDYSDK
jgi:hypothetical protein